MNKSEFIEKLSGEDTDLEYAKYFLDRSLMDVIDSGGFYNFSMNYDFPRNKITKEEGEYLDKHFAFSREDYERFSGTCRTFDLPPLDVLKAGALEYQDVDMDCASSAYEFILFLALVMLKDAYRSGKLKK